MNVTNTRGKLNLSRQPEVERLAQAIGCDEFTSSTPSPALLG
jgi:hypothetical protein